VDHLVIEGACFTFGLAGMGDLCTNSAGQTFAAEKLSDQGLEVSADTLRLWLMPKVSGNASDAAISTAAVGPAAPASAN
jgi:hypothetical protein